MVKILLISFLLISAIAHSGTLKTGRNYVQVPLESFLETELTEDTSSDEVTDVPVQDEDAESQTIPQGDSDSAPAEVEDESTQMMTVDYSDEEKLNTTASAKDAANGIVSQVLEYAYKNDQLYMTNLKLSREIEDLEEMLDGAVGKINSARLSELNLVSKLNEEMKVLDQYYGAILNDPEKVVEAANNIKAEVEKINEEKAEEEEQKEDNEDDEDEDLEASSTMVCVIGLGFLFLILRGARSVFGALVENGLKTGIYALMADIALLVVVWSATVVADYGDWFDEDRLDFDMIVVGVALFILIWMMQGLWLIFLCHLYAKQWKRQEKIIGNPDKEMPAGLASYGIMRYLFLNPSYFPSVTESYLSSNFNFAEYLTRALGEILKSVYSFSWLGFFLMLFAIFCWRIALEGDNTLEIAIFFVVPAILLLIWFCVYMKLKLIFKLLVPQVDNFERKVSPEINPEEIKNIVPMPLYLEGQIPDEEIRILYFKINPMKLTCGYIFIGQYPTKHELLFWFDSYGPQFFGSIIQALNVILTLWLVVVLIYYISMLDDEVGGLTAIFIIFAILFWTILACICIPLAVRLYCITTKIEMLKDRNLINEAVQVQKAERSMRTMRIYRQVKSIYRDYQRSSNEENLVNLKPDVLNLTDEVYHLEAQNKQIYVTQIDNILELVGVRLTEDELRLLAKECSPSADNNVNFKGFKTALERILAGKGYKPQEVIKKTFKAYIELAKGKDESAKTISLRNLSEFFKEYSWHLNDDDMREFLKDIKYFTGNSGKMTTNDFGGIFRDEVSRLPK
ncbi:unnamed protein product [Blepharisma stoltei]|uniref:Uncharacterized protein n=1 Tax=Blepharisma stoltei TaxID=1481888 RepID=A0AAU9J7M2_9CILI|nr:unnamed protein product [Blepharisma stoltei]